MQVKRGDKTVELGKDKIRKMLLPSKIKRLENEMGLEMDREVVFDKRNVVEQLKNELSMLEAKFNFKEINEKRIPIKILPNINKLLALSEKSFVKGLFQASLFYFFLLLEMLLAEKLKTSRFKSLYNTLSISNVKKIDEMTLGAKLSSDEINERMFKIYDKNFKYMVLGIRNTNMHKFDEKMHVDVISKLKDAQKLFLSIK